MSFIAVPYSPSRRAVAADAAGLLLLMLASSFQRARFRTPSLFPPFRCRKRVQKYSFFRNTQAFSRIFFQKFFSTLIHRRLRGAFFHRRTRDGRRKRRFPPREGEKRRGLGGGTGRPTGVFRGIRRTGGAPEEGLAARFGGPAPAGRED